MSHDRLSNRPLGLGGLALAEPSQYALQDGRVCSDDCSKRHPPPGPKVGLTLGAGSARGIAHIGVIKALVESGVPVDVAAATSISRLVGLLYACDCDLDMVAEMVGCMKIEQLVDLCVPRMGIITWEKIDALLDLISQRRRIEDLRILAAAVATDPGADIVIAVSIRCDRRTRVRTVVDVISQALDLMRSELLALKTPTADLVVEPLVGDVPPFRLDMVDTLVERGRDATLKCLPQLIAMLQRRNVE